jgi:TIGR03009 family protein
MAHLQGWEKATKGAANFYTECSLKRTNLALKKETEYTGSIMCLKPNLARMRIDRKPAPGAKPDPNDYTAYICTGQAVYEYDGTAKQVTEIPLRNGGVGDNLLLEFMSGNLTAAQAVQRFAIKTLKPEDQHYIYLDIRPLTPKDKGEFESMILVLFRPTVTGMEYLPRTVVIRKPNGQEEEVWDFPRPAVNVKGIDKAVFQFVPPPKDWKFQKAGQQPAGPAPAPGQPRVARPTGP